MKVVVTGYENFNDYKFLSEKIKELLNNTIDWKNKDTEVEFIVRSETTTGDLIKRFVNEFACYPYYARFELFSINPKYGEDGKLIRDDLMIKYAGKNSILIDFEKESSKKLIIDKAKEIGLDIHIFEVKDN